MWDCLNSGREYAQLCQDFQINQFEYVEEINFSPLKIRGQMQ